MREPQEGSPPSSPSKFDSCEGDVIFVTIASIAVLILISFHYIIKNLFEGDIISSYEGLQLSENEKSVFILLLIHSPTVEKTFSNIFLDFKGDSQNKDAYNVVADILCQWGQAPTLVAKQSMPEAVVGKNRVYSTGLFNYDSLLLQIHITGNITKLSSVTVSAIHTKQEFFNQCNSIRKTFSYIGIIMLSFYLISFLTISPNLRTVDHYLVILSILISIFANSPKLLENLISNYIANYSLSLLLSGFYQSTNYVLLLCLVIRITSDESIITTCILSLLSIFADGLAELTYDSSILAKYFENNTTLWVFFFTMSVASKCTLLCASMWKILNYLLKTGRSSSSVIYLMLFVVCHQYVSFIAKGLFYLLYSYGSSALDFNSRYLSQFITTMAIADIYWPSPKRQNRTSSVNNDQTYRVINHS